MCTSKYHSKPRYRGIDGVNIGVKLLYEHIGTPLRYLTQRCPTPKAKRTGQRSVRKVKQNDLAFLMNHLVGKVLKKVISCLLIMKLNRIKREGSRRRRGRTTTSYWVLRKDIIFSCHEKETKTRERGRERTCNASWVKNMRHKKEEKEYVQCMIMHEHVMC